MGSFLSSSCETRYPELEYYFCYGCHTTEPTSSDTGNKVIRLCKKFAERLWGGDLDSSTDKFDACGFNFQGNVEIPSHKWSNALSFFNDVKPPIFSAWTVQIVNSETDCFNSSSPFGLMAFFALVLAILSI